MNKKSPLMAVLAMALCLFSQNIFAQASGVKPELFMYRHNSAPGGIATPVIPGNILGTIRWDGLSNGNLIRNGAVIRSNVKSVGVGSLGADLVFSTGNGVTYPIPDRMIINESGLVGIGTMTPQYHLHVIGNTHTSGNFFGRIHMDNNPVDALPSTYNNEAYFERKSRALLGLGASAYTDGGALTLSPSGLALDRQLFFGDDAIWTRAQNAGGADAWDVWTKLLTSGDIKGAPNRIARFLPPDNPSSKIGDSQLFDDGTAVGIGTVTPDNAFLLTVGGETRFNGRTRTVGNAEVTGSLFLDGDANVDDDILVGSDATVVGNTSSHTLNVGTSTQTGSLLVNTNATVDNNCRVNNQLIVGNPASAPGPYKLFVNGSAIAEEVVVKLQASWPDYVFEQEYPLQPLPEVAAFIQENKHLPGVPSAAEIADSGLALGQTQKAQMEKIEELFLHMIALEKRVQQLETENAALKAANEQNRK